MCKQDKGKISEQPQKWKHKTSKEPAKAHPNNEGVDRDYSATAEVKPLQSWSSEERRRTDFELNATIQNMSKNI